MATEQGQRRWMRAWRNRARRAKRSACCRTRWREAAQAATQIAATSQQQFVGMDQVALAMENIKVASTQAVASTRQAETAAQSLHNLGQQFKELVGKFKVN